MSPFPVVPSTLATRVRPAAARVAPVRPAPVLRLDTLAKAPATLREAIARLEGLANELEGRGDRRAIFAGTYAIQLRAFEADVAGPGRYQDPAWMTRMTLDFVQRYSDAFDAYERQDWPHVPTAWRVAFDQARAGDGPATSDLLLAMNAHINHDLPLSLVAAGMSPLHERDFTLFGEVLATKVDDVQALLANRFLKPSRGVTWVERLDRWLGRGDEALAATLITEWRSAAWKNAEALAGRDPRAYKAVTQRADRRAALFHRLAGWVPDCIVRKSVFLSFP